MEWKETQNEREKERDTQREIYRERRRKSGSALTRLLALIFFVSTLFSAVIFCTVCCASLSLREDRHTGTFFSFRGQLGNIFKFINRDC